MYEGYYRLDKAPFQATPDPAFLYSSPTHREALASIVYGVEERKGFILLLAEVGLGKTTILRAFLEGTDQAKLTLAYVFNSNVSFKELLEAILHELGIKEKPGSVSRIVNRLHQFAIDEYRQGRNVVLIVDEAQNMPVQTLESLRTLSNLETSTEKLFQIVLAGQPELADTLALRELRQLKQRIALRCTLAPFTEEESLAYIEHRIAAAGASGAAVFTPGAMLRIVRHAQGIPRTLNILCDNALVTGLGYQRKPVTAAIVGEVIADLEGTGRGDAPRLEASASLGSRLGMAVDRLASTLRTLLRRLPEGAALWPALPRRWVMWASLAAILITAVVLLGSPFRRDSLPRQGNPPGALSPSEPSGQALQTPASPAAEGRRTKAASQAPVRPARGAAGRPIAGTRVVKPGDTLCILARDVYGVADERVIRRVVESNPDITDINTIVVGSTVRFPDVSDLRSSRPAAAAPRK